MAFRNRAAEHERAEYQSGPTLTPILTLTELRSLGEAPSGAAARTTAIASQN